MADKPDWKSKLNSRTSVYLSGVVLGFVIGGWYREQSGPINWWVIAFGVALVVIVVLSSKDKRWK